MVVLPLLAVASAAVGQPVPMPKDYVEKAGRYLDALSKAGRFSGSALIAIDGKVVFRKAYGYADWSARRPMTPETPVPLFSIGKSFTAGAILLLQDRGKLNVQDPASKYLANLPAAWKDITIHQFLTHTSGIGTEDTLAWYRKAVGPIEPWLLADDGPKKAAPGEKFEYSNAGYMVLAKIVEKVAKESLGLFLRDNVFVPLRMTGAGMGGHWEGQPQVARGHTVFGGKMVPLDQRLTIIPGAGDIHANVDDLLKWRQAIDGGTLFSKAARDALHARQAKIDDETFYSYGWMYHTEWPMWEHTGGGASCQTSLATLPDRKMTIIVLNNGDATAGPLPAWRLAEMAYGSETRLPRYADLDLMDRLQGVYRDAKGAETVVRLESGNLFVRLPGKESQPMECAGWPKFQGGGIVAAFSPRKDGRFAMRLTLNGKTVVSTTQEASENLEDYVGKYDATPIERRGRWLVVPLLLKDMSPDPFLMTLLPSGRDRFVVSPLGVELSFVRNRRGRVAAVKTIANGKVVSTSKRR